MDKYTGKRLDGRYEIQELIGVGGMATVYKAYDNIDDRTVAIKILKDEYLGNEEFIRRFKNESKAIAVLSHPNIVKVYDVSFGDRIQYIVMEYIDGITLQEYIGQQNIVPWKEAVHFTVQILKALRHAHAKGIVHRDIKPQNIMLLQDGSIKVTDFGIARFFDNELHKKGDMAIGSVHYIAPEQARNGDTDGKADIYSVGVMLYEMLTGKLPFEADSAVSVAIMQLQNDPRPLREINDQIPQGIEEITLKAMRKDPAQRYESAGEMLEAIEMFRRDPGIHFGYKYFEDKAPTKYVDSINNVRTAVPEPIYEDNYTDDDEDELVASRSKTAVKWVIACVSILVVVAMVVFGVNIWQNAMRSTEVPSVDVPKFVGQSIEDVKKNKAYKFNFEITAKYDDGQPLNIVLSQEPEEGTKQIKENATVKLTVNSTSTTTEVPKLRNYLEQEAIEKLKGKYLNYDVQRVNSTDVAKGYVIDCSPQQGTSQEIGTPITLIVSDGPVPEKVDVPVVSGYGYESAKAELESLGFTTQKANVASALDAGKVIGTDPLPGNKLTKGSLVTIQVSDGSKKIKSLEYQLDLPADEYAEITVTVYVDGKKQEEENGAPALGYKKKLTLNPDGARDNQKNVIIMIDGARYEDLVFDFKKQTVSRTYLNINYKIKQGASNEKLDDVKKEAKNELSGYLNLDEYDSDGQNLINEILAEYNEKIDKAETEDRIAEVVAAAKEKLNAVEKKPESSDDPLRERKDSAIDEIRNYRSDEIESLSAHAKDLIDRSVSGYEDSINNAESKDDIKSLKKDAFAAIDEIIAEDTPEEPSPTDDDSSEPEE